MSNLCLLPTDAALPGVTTWRGARQREREGEGYWMYNTYEIFMGKVDYRWLLGGRIWQC